MAALLVWSEPYRLQRLTGFLNPWNDPYGTGYQLTQALIAFGRGEWLGVGLGNSIQKQFYLPEAHTDFVFSVLAEELGMVGALAAFAWRWLSVARGSTSDSWAGPPVGWSPPILAIALPIWC